MSIFNTFSKKFNEDNFKITNGKVNDVSSTYLQDRLSNLVDLRNILNKFNIKYALAYGTLLGCIRKNKLIPWDTDDDIYIFDEQLNKFNSLFLHEMEKQNFKLLRANPNSISFIRNGCYVDLMRLVKTKNKTYFYKHPTKIEFDCHYFDTLELYQIENEFFSIPSDYKNILKLMYGPEWEIENKNGRHCKVLYSKLNK